jgi:hypothetical protein
METILFLILISILIEMQHVFNEEKTSHTRYGFGFLPRIMKNTFGRLTNFQMGNIWLLGLFTSPGYSEPLCELIVPFTA